MKVSFEINDDDLEYLKDHHDWIENNVEKSIEVLLQVNLDGTHKKVLTDVYVYEVEDNIDLELLINDENNPLSVLDLGNKLEEELGIESWASGMGQGVRDLQFQIHPNKKEELREQIKSFLNQQGLEEDKHYRV